MNDDLRAWSVTCPNGHETDFDSAMKSKIYTEDGVDFDSWYAQCEQCGEKAWLRLI